MSDSQATNTPPAATRLSYISFATTISALAVVTLHTNGIFWHYDKVSAQAWASANVLESVYYFAVPVFFMVSGTTLIDYRDRYTTGVFFRKRITKTLIPFLVWSLFGLAYVIAFKNGAQQFGSLTAALDGIINTKIVTIYWFFPVLFLYYLTVPIFANIPAARRLAVVAYAAGIGLLVNSLLPLLTNTLLPSISWPYKFGPAANLTILALLGYVIARVDFTIKQRALIYLLALIALVLHAWGTYALTTAKGSIDSTFKGYDNLPSVLYAAGIYLLLKQVGSLLPKRLSQFFEWLAAYSFPVYLIHWFFLDALNHIIAFDQTTLLYRLGMPFLVYAAIIPITWLARRLPWLGKILLP